MKNILITNNQNIVPSIITPTNLKKNNSLDWSYIISIYVFVGIVGLFGVKLTSLAYDYYERNSRSNDYQPVSRWQTRHQTNYQTFSSYKRLNNYPNHLLNQKNTYGAINFFEAHNNRERFQDFNINFESHYPHTNNLSDEIHEIMHR